MEEESDWEKLSVSSSSSSEDLFPDGNASAGLENPDLPKSKSGSLPTSPVYYPKPPASSMLTPSAPALPALPGQIPSSMFGDRVTTQRDVEYYMTVATAAFVPVDRLVLMIRTSNLLNESQRLVLLSSLENYYYGTLRWTLLKLTYRF